MTSSENEKGLTGALIQGNNLLAVNLHKLLAQSEDNVFFSPFSLSSSLAMLLYGTRGDAASEMRQALGLKDIDNNDLASTFKTLLSSLESAVEGYTISSANSLVVHKDFSVHQQYITDLACYFKAACTQADLVNESEAAIKNINSWVSEVTHKMIPKLLESLDSNTVMVLLNAVHFKGYWLHQFKEKSNFMQYFYNNGLEDGATLIEMMHIKESFPLASNESFQVLQLPYKGDEIGMMILLPNSRDGLKEVENAISPNFIQDAKKEMRKQKVQVALPKFRLEYSKDLKDSFKNLGINQIFECAADFGGFSDCKNIAVSQVVHKAVLEVNEEGCEAAAATAIAIQHRKLEIVPEFIVDHPFLFVIFNVKNDLILFMGQVNELGN